MNFHVVSDIEEEKIIFASLWPEEHDEKREILHFAVYKNLPLINSQRIRWEKLKIERDRILVFSSISLFDHLFIDLEKKFIRRYWIYLEKKKGLNDGNQTETRSWICRGVNWADRTECEECWLVMLADISVLFDYINIYFILACISEMKKKIAEEW